MSVLITVMAHADAQATFDRHLPLWEHHGLDLMVMCPIDAMVRTDHTLLTTGNKSHHNAEAIRRFRSLLETLLETEHDRFIIHEYDSFCLSKDIGERLDTTRVLGNAFPESDHSRFKGTVFFHPPLDICREALEDIVDAGRHVSDLEACGFWDRWLGQVCDVGSIPWSGWCEHGFSKNTIEPSDIGAAVTAKRNGATRFHGVKTRQVLEAILAA